MQDPPYRVHVYHRRSIINQCLTIKFWSSIFNTYYSQNAMGSSIRILYPEKIPIDKPYAKCVYYPLPSQYCKRTATIKSRCSKTPRKCVKHPS